MDTIGVKLVNKSKFEAPMYATAGSSGCDLRADIDEPVLIGPSKITLVPTGIYIGLPEGYEAQVRSRSGLALKHGIVVANGVGTIDSDYRGEIGVIIANISDAPYEILPGERIAQLVFCPVARAVFAQASDLPLTERDSGGFGHTGNM
ncbi:MAG: dUTP diphosphatase [Eubacteriaceae bacterium]|nr:dUTP diphosphatase [Eubacteriaceae bacterium]